MFEKSCLVCGDLFLDGDKIAAVMLSTYKAIDSDVHFAITHPTGCLEIFHVECYNGNDYQEPELAEIN